METPFLTSTPRENPALANGVGCWHTAAQPDLSLRDFWHILARRKSTIVATTAACLLLALAVSLVMTPKYESVSVIEVNKENSDILGLDTLQTGVSDSLDYTLTLETQANVLRSDSLAFQVAEQLGLEKHKEFSLAGTWFDADRTRAEQSLPLEKAPLRRRTISRAFEKSLTVKTIPGTRMIEVHFLNPDPQLAADIANTLVGDYLEQYFRTRYNATAQASEWLSKQLAELRSQAEEAQEKVVQYQKAKGILGTDEANNVVMAKLEELNKQLTAAEANRMLKQTGYQIAKSGNAELISTVGSSNLLGSLAGMNSNPLALIQSLRSQQAELKVQYAQAASKYGPAYPRLIQLRNQSQELDRAIQAEIDKVVATLQQVVQEQQGRVEKVEKQGVRKLAYRVHKLREGFYVYLSLRSSQGELIKELERRLKVSDMVMKYLTVRLDEELKRQEKLSRHRERRAARRPRKAAQTGSSEQAAATV
jgi:ribosomal protein S6